jgi:GH24 family phage-related lysozyme (muramidase)
METKYTYKRKDGGTTTCYGELTKESNFELICADETKDGIAADVEMKSIWNWEQVCKYLEANYDSEIEEIIAC